MLSTALIASINPWVISGKELTQKQLFIAKYSKASRELYIFNNCFGHSQVFLILNAMILGLICKEEISSWSLEGSKMGWKRFTYLLTTALEEVCSVLITQPENLNLTKTSSICFHDKDFNHLSPNIHIQILQTGLSLKNRHFLFGDHFINSHNRISSQCMDIVRRKLMFVTIGT